MQIPPMFVPAGDEDDERRAATRPPLSLTSAAE